MTDEEKRIIDQHEIKFNKMGPAYFLHHAEDVVQKAGKTLETAQFKLGFDERDRALAKKAIEMGQNEIDRVRLTDNNDYELWVLPIKVASWCALAFMIDKFHHPGSQRTVSGMFFDLDRGELTDASRKEFLAKNDPKGAATVLKPLILMDSQAVYSLEAYVYMISKGMFPYGLSSERFSVHGGIGRNPLSLLFHDIAHRDACFGNFNDPVYVPSSQERMFAVAIKRAQILAGQFLLMVEKEKNHDNKRKLLLAAFCCLHEHDIYLRDKYYYLDLSGTVRDYFHRCLKAVLDSANLKVLDKEDVYNSRFFYDLATLVQTFSKIPFVHIYKIQMTENERKNFDKVMFRTFGLLELRNVLSRMPSDNNNNNSAAKYSEVIAAIEPFNIVGFYEILPGGIKVYAYDIDQFQDLLFGENSLMNWAKREYEKTYP